MNKNSNGVKNIFIGIIVVGIIIVGGIFLLGGNDNVTDSNEGGITENNTSSQDNTKSEQNFDKAPEFSLEDFDGNLVTLDTFATKIAVVNSWAVWCPFCVDELADFVILQDEFKDDIIVIAIDRQESQSTQESFLASVGIATDDLVFLNDPRDSFYKTGIGGIGMPETIFVDSEKNIRFHKRGPMDLEEMREITLSILQE